jgi:hypothetical protein
MRRGVAPTRPDDAPRLAASSGTRCRLRQARSRGLRYPRGIAVMLVRPMPAPQVRPGLAEGFAGPGSRRAGGDARRRCRASGCEPVGMRRTYVSVSMRFAAIESITPLGESRRKYSMVATGSTVGSGATGGRGQRACVKIRSIRAFAILRPTSRHVYAPPSKRSSRRLSSMAHDCT